MAYDSSFTNRFGSDEMRLIWSETTRRRLWRRICLAQAEALAASEVISGSILPDLRAAVDAVDLTRSAEVQAGGVGDAAAEIQLLLENVAASEAALLSSATAPADVIDNADVLLQRTALSLVLARLKELMKVLADSIDRYADIVIISTPRLPPCLPTTLGYHLAVHGQDLCTSLAQIDRLRTELRGKGIKGAVGTGAALYNVLETSDHTPSQLERQVLAGLKIEAFHTAASTYPRSQDLWLLSALSVLAASLHHFGEDLRLLAMEGLVTWGPSARQLGAAVASPDAGEPPRSERLASLARLVASSFAPAWQAAAIPDTGRAGEAVADRRLLIPPTFLALDALLLEVVGAARTIRVDAEAASAQVMRFGAFGMLGPLADALVRQGARRDEIEDRLDQHRLASWQPNDDGQSKALQNRLASDTFLLRYLQPASLEELLDAPAHVGWAPQRAREMAGTLRQAARTAE